MRIAFQVVDSECKKTVEVKRADIRLLQPPWADELEDVGSHGASASALHLQHLRIHQVPQQVSYHHSNMVLFSVQKPR